MRKFLVFIHIILLGLRPPVIAQTSQTVPNGGTTTPITLSCSGLSWTNNNPSIGLAASGTGNIAAFTAINTGSTPVTATIKYSPAGYAFVPTFAGGVIDMINIITGTIINRISFAKAQAITVSPDQQFVYAQGTGGIAKINTSNGSIVGTYLPGLPIGDKFVISADGSTLYMSSGTTSDVYVINTSTMTLTATIVTEPPITGSSQTAGMVLSPDGSKLYVADTQTGNVCVISTATNIVLGRYLVGPGLGDLAISPDGSKLYCTNQQISQVSVVNTTSFALLATIPADFASACLLSADGTTLYVTDVSSDVVFVINTATNAITSTITVGMNPFGMSFTPDGGQLYVSDDGSNTIDVIDVSTNTVVNTIAVDNQPDPWGNFIANACGTTPYTYTITVNPSASITAGAVSGTITACSGSPSASPNILTFSVSGSYLTADITATAPAGFEISLAAGSGYSSSVTLTQTAGTVSNIPVYIRSAASAPVGNLSGNVVLSTTGATSQNVAVTGMVSALVTPTISIAGSANGICAGTSVTFTATPVNPGTAPAYQWQLNGGNAGTNSAVFSSTTLNNGDQVSCILTSNAACPTTVTASSNTVTMTVDPMVTPAVSIVASDNGVCVGTPFTFTATPVNPGTTPAYQWQVNGGNVGPNSSTLNISTLNNGDQVSCVLTSNAACLTTATASSTPVVINITQTITPTVTIAPSNPEVCAGSPVTFTATVSNGGTSPGYQWTVNGVAEGSNSDTYTSQSLHDGDEIVCIISGSLSCSVPGTAAPVFVAVDPLPKVSFLPATVYEGNNPIPLAPSITGTIASYAWTPANGLSATNIANPTADPANNQIYQLVVTTDKGCTATGKVTVIIRLPALMANAFTPNGDGHNDVFLIPRGSMSTLDQFSIFNRQGAEVFTTRNPAEGWDGTYQGQPAPAGTYVYVVKGKDAHGNPVNLNGTVMLIR